MQPPISPRGPLSQQLLETLRHDPELSEPDVLGAVLTLAETTVAKSPDVIRDGDVQLTLFLLYALHYDSLGAFAVVNEWHPDLIKVRSVIEKRFEEDLRAAVPVPDLPELTRDAVAEALFDLTQPHGEPGLSKFIARAASRDQAVEYLVQRSVYTLREADPHSLAIPRLTGDAKAALVEIQSDEYGGGRPDRVHATIYAKAMRGAGLDPAYGRYVDCVPAITLASFNMITMFGMHRRLLGAIVGHLAAFEMTSSLPCRDIADGLRRLGFGEDVTDYYDEHVEADAVHEQIAGRDLAGAFAEQRPHALGDIMFGAAACLTIDGEAAEFILEKWKAGQTSLLRPLDPHLLKPEAVTLVPTRERAATR